MATYNTVSGAFEDLKEHRWWSSPEDQAGDVMVSVAQSLETDTTWQRLEFLLYARLYTNRLLSSLYQATSRGQAVPYIGGWDKRLSLNVVEACVNTASAKIAKNKPRVLFLTQGGDFKLRRKAKQLTKFTDGLFDANDIYENIGQDVFRDACVYGTGFVHVYADEESGEIRAERVLPFEILCNESEATYGEPRSLYRRKFVHRSVLLDEYPEHAEAIRAATAADPTDLGSWTTSDIDMIPVYEGWHLPTGKTAGRHVVGIKGAAFVNEPWKKDYFPIVMFHWETPITGIWGKGIAEQLTGIQAEINRTMRHMQLVLRRMAVPTIYVEHGGKVNTAELNDEIGRIVYHNAGQKPTQDAGTAFPPELSNWYESKKREAFEITGISQLSATARKPDGLNAAVAIREFHDIESERFILVGQRFERMYIDIARIMLDLARDMYTSKPGTKIKAPGTRTLEMIAWKDVDLREDEYEMRAFPVSILPTTPSGRLQRIEELYKGGFISKPMALSLMDFPDLESAVSLETASYDLTCKMLDAITDEGKYEPPEPYMDLKQATTMAQYQYLRGRMDGVPEKRLELLQRWIDECQHLLGLSAPPSPAAPAALPPLPGGEIAAPAAPPLGLPGEVPALPSALPASPLPTPPS